MKRIFSKQHRQKLSEAAKGNNNGFKKGYVQSEEQKRKLRLARLGKKHSKEWKRKISERLKGHTSWTKGRKRTQEELEKWRVSMKKTYDRKGRKKYKRYIHVKSKELIQWRSNVFLRDNWTCQICGIRGRYLEAHHLKSWAKFPELRYELENGVTLCKECHKLTDNYKNNKNGS